MPVFHTKTIESILDPVAQQVSRLVIIHEEGEAGHEMPDLERPVQAVSKAVANLAKVGREMVHTTDDSILKQDMPMAITKVENAATLLEDASNLSKSDPFCKTARTKLIEGSRWILQGTSGVLLCFDESEVRKIIRECKKVLDYLSVAEVIDSMEDLVQFVKDLSPCLSKVTREVEKRMEDLTHQVHRESLARCVDQVKTLAPILICSMKIYVQIVSHGGKGSEEAAENRNYLAARMTDEVGEVIRVLQLVTYDEEEWSSDNIQVMKKTIANIDSKLQSAQDWLREPTAVQGGLGEKSLRAILDMAEKVAERSLPLDADHLRRLAGDVSAMTDALCELRATGRGTTAQAENLARNIQSRLGEVVASVGQAYERYEKSGVQQPAPTIVGRLEQCRRWLEQPGVDDRGVGSAALQLIVEEADKVAERLPGHLRGEILGIKSRVEAEHARLLEAVRRGEAGSAPALSLARSLNNNVAALADCIQSALVDRVVEDFVDIATPLKLFTDCVLAPGDPETREEVFDARSGNLVNFSDRVANTARLVATGNNSGNKKLAEALISTAGQVESLTPQLVNAGRIRMVYPENKAADEHFENLRRQFAETVTLTRTLADEATDSARFVGQSLAAMQEFSTRCDEAIATRQPAKMVENTSSIARLANRVLQLTKQEADNSEDPKYISVLNIAADQLQSRVSPMVQSAKSVAMNIEDPVAVDGWRRRNGLLLEAVQSVHKAVKSNDREDQEPPLPPYPELRNLRLDEVQTNGSSSTFSPPLSPLPPPLEFQSSPKVARSKSDAAVQGRAAVSKSNSSSAVEIASSSSGSHRQQTALTESRSFTSSSSSKQTFQELKSSGGVVRNAVANNEGKIVSSTAAEADILIEELMEEAKKDPSFGVVPGLNSPVQPDSRPGSSAGPAPFVPRPYRTAQDMIIRDKSEERTGRLGRSQEKHTMPSRPYRTATDFKIEDTTDAHTRSKSADTRLKKPFAIRDPKLSNFQRTNSTENFTGEMMQEVVTDNKHRSVKDLIANLEKSTKSESENPYVRRWGCDLISPEPRRRDVTCRYQKKQMPDPEFAHKLSYQMSDYGGSRVSSRNRNYSETSRDSPEPFLDTYTAEIDDLVERQHGEQDIGLIYQDQVNGNESNHSHTNKSSKSVQRRQEEDERPESAAKVVVWPPTNDIENLDSTNNNNNNNYVHNTNTNFSTQSQQFSSQKSSQKSMQMSQNFEQSSSVKSHIVNEADSLVQQRRAKKVQSNDKVEMMNKKNSEKTEKKEKMTNGFKYERSSLCELDAQIMDIQTQFESELESLIDTYKSIQDRKSQGGEKVTEELCTLRSNNSTIRETAELLCQELSDDEGTYQAHDIVFDTQRSKEGEAPPRPPPPSGGKYGNYVPPRPPPPPDTDDEADNMFSHAPTPSQGPIMMAAHDLHQEVRQWSSKDNDIIAAAKKMALLMAKLSQLVQEDSGSKKELIAIAKAIAEASDEVTRLAKELAMECTDKRMRTNLLSVCERIPTIGTQLKILSTVKATMLGAQGTEEDIEATEMLVGNAQNLMQSVKQTVTAAEAASIKIRTDAGIRLRWVRKQPWYQY